MPPAAPGGSASRGNLSPWWRYGALGIIAVEFTVLALVAVSAYRVAAPIPARTVDPAGALLFTGADIMAGQNVFQRYGLMDNGTVWGHGAYMGPDFTALHLHRLALTAGEMLSQRSFGLPAASLSREQKTSLTGSVGDLLSENRYDYRSGTLVFSEPEAASFRQQVGQWRDYFAAPHISGGLPPKYITDPEEIRQLTAFFAWTAWASTAHIPGKTYSYTMNFPYEPEIGNGPTRDAVVWSGISLLALLAGTAAVLLAFGRFDYLGWRGVGKHVHPSVLPGGATRGQKATVKFFVVVAALFLVQTLVGGALAHYNAQPEGFYGYDLSSVLPGNILRIWHLQTAIFWIATAFVGGGLFLASALGGDFRGQTKLTNVLFGALVVVVVGSLVGEFAGTRQLVGHLWFWFGNQGWEYLEIGRFWQVLLLVGLALWVVIIVKAAGPARESASSREITTLFLLAAASIPVFYIPALFFGSMSHFTVVDTWRFWIIHLWVEGFFELFATVMVAVMFYKLGMVHLDTATRVIYLDVILFLGSGIIGTGHHWYWTGQSNVSMALAATFSAMEVVPLVLLTLDAWPFVSLMRQTCEVCGKRVDLPHKWTFYFLIAVGVWNFIGAGMFGLFINLPITSYYQAGTVLAANHGHGALMGVFGMLALALLVFALRQVSTDDHWRRVERYIKVSFWSLNAGLALMMILSMFPVGVLQFADAATNGYWHARGVEFLRQPRILLFAWLRLPADALFIVGGVVPLLAATILTYRHMLLRERRQ